MIRYVRGADAAAAAPITPVGTIADGEEPLAVRTEIHVGPATREVLARLGAWPVSEPDPAGPGGLVGMPVVVLPVGADLELARAGALRAGGWPTVLILPGDAPRLGIQLLVARTSGVAISLIDGGGPTHLLLARVLGGRPLPVLTLEHRDEVAAILDASGVDLDVAIPSLRGDAEFELWTELSSWRLEERHHPLEVDPRPAFAELGRSVEGTSRLDLATGAAGVLAGRLAAAGARWTKA